MPDTHAIAAANAAIPSLLTDSAERAMVVVAHPDDETIGAGARIGRFREALVVHVTDGAPRSGADARNAGCATWQDYAALRRRELEAAVALAGLPAGRLLELGYPDQGASLDMTAPARRIAALIKEHRPHRLLTQPYEGGHPDHDATAFAAHAALALLRREGHPLPAVEEMASYQDGDGDGVTSFQEFLPLPGQPVRTVRLDGTERALKRRMLDAHASQAATLSPFRDDVERYRDAPLYDFTRTPHAGLLNYERFDWGMTGERWRGLASDALAALGLEDTAWR
ncbi:PIG-L family deacetylase [Azospirillum sp. SYSU D00513]|uniref:PIG-L deacetylase family protein n=1 Tax=Azospirillum sp. SYSU D00513 TaxID=2812561 RepID=UPI001A95D07D|nr:PIG-L family deacetylase [Azospirillum sp. SYSU D00513]